MRLPRIFRKTLLISVTVIGFANSNAAEPPKKPGIVADDVPGAAVCRDIISAAVPQKEILRRDRLARTKVGDLSLVSSGRDENLFPEYVKAAEEIFGKDGVAHKLGIAVPPHQLTFVPSDRLAILASIGHHAIPHWYDGMKIARQAKGAAGVLEFVTPGCPTCRSFYRDTSSFPVQISIMFHVAGHNDFSVYSPFALRRQADPIAASLELAEMVQDYSRRFDADAVHLFYQYLSSFSFLQDINYGEFTHPDHLNNAGLRDADLKRVVHGEGKRDPYREAGVIGPFPKQPNISGLQAMVGYLKGRGPEWKYKLASKYEEMVRVYGYVPVTKIMNEGWATFLQIFLTAHSRWNNSKSVLEFANLLSGVAYPQLTNPYWMGLEAWLRVYKNFVKENPIGPGMTMLERDRRFVQHAHGMIEWMTDADFLRHALDEQWVTDMNLFLSRPASEQEVDPTLPPDPMHPDYNEQNVVVSRDPKRVINFITDLVANKKKHLPRITVKNMRSLDRNVFHFAHEVYENYPLERSSTAQTLYVAAQVLGAPVALDTIDQRKVIKQMPYPEDWPDFWRRFMPPPTTVTYEPVPIRVEVDLGGKVAVFEQVKNAADGELLERENKEIATEMQAAIAAYQDSVTGLVNGDLERDWRHLYADSGKMMMRIADHNTTHVIEGVVHDPNSSAAIAEYTRVIKSVGPARLRELMKRARRTATGIAIPILPDIPEFSFDREMVETLKNLEPPAPVDANERIRPFEKILSATSKTSNSGVGALIASTTIDLSRYAGTSASVQMLLDQVKSFVNQAGRREIIFTGSDKAERLVQEVMNVLLKESVSTIDGRTIDLSNTVVWLETKDGTRVAHSLPQKRNTTLVLSMAKKEGGVTPGQGPRRPGDRFWGPKPGQGKGPGKPGDPGTDPSQPHEIEISLEDYGRILAEDMELPNIRRTRGQSEKVKWVTEGSMLKPEGEVDWIRTVVAPNAYGRGRMNEELRNLRVARELAEKDGNTLKVAEIDEKIASLRRKISSVMSRVQRGMMMTTEADYVTEKQEPVTIPDFKAVLFVMVDMSGSMGGIRQETAKNIAFKTRAVLRHFYKHLEIVYVGFDTEGHELTEQQVFHTFLGGGTAYSGGLAKVQELYPRYPVEQYNRYLIMLGDGETGEADAQDSIKILEDLYEETQYMGFGYLTLSDWGGGFNWSGPFTQSLKNWAADKEWFGFADVNDSSEEAQIETIKKFFGKK